MNKLKRATAYMRERVCVFERERGRESVIDRERESERESEREREI